MLLERFCVRPPGWPCDRPYELAAPKHRFLPTWRPRLVASIPGVLGAGEPAGGLVGASLGESPTSAGDRGRGEGDTARWLRELSGDGSLRDQALARLHTLLLRVARAEVNRRRGWVSITGPELEDLAHQAADDALIAITAKLKQFRGESRFTTWAYKFVVLEVSTKLGRHFWRRPTVSLGSGDWERLPDRFGSAPDDQAERLEMIRLVSRAVAEELTPHQREVFTAIVIDGVPLDALALKLGSNRNALYKTMFDARRKLKAKLVADGYMCDSAKRDDPARSPKGGR